MAASVRVLMLSDLREKGDVKNWLDAGGTAERLRELADAAPIWTAGDNAAPDDRPAVVRFSDLERQAPRWLWPGRIPLGKLTLIIGDPGTGKSTLVAELAARVSRGVAWPDAPEKGIPAGDVLLVNLEDDPEDTTGPRLDAAGADVSRIYTMLKVLSLDTDLAVLDRALTDRARLLVIDPITACLGRIDSHKNAEVRGALAPLAMLAARRGVAVVAIHHLNKSTTGPALYRAAGSLAFAAAARAVWLVSSDREDKRRRLFLPVKNNLAEALTGLAYRIEGDAAREVGRIVWESRPIELSADDALAILSPEEREQRHAREEAKEWLLETLGKEAIWTKDLQTLAKENGHSWQTVRRALRDIDAQKRKRGGGKDAKWYWRLAAGDEARPLLAGLEDDGAADETAPELVELADRRKPR
jgi:hypothetical protein